jgi:ABC-type bacteriocin/lantibiotic exporter with double-glycine peptidase domain
MRRLTCGIIALLTLAAVCAMAATPTGLWLDVPFVKQPKEGCGAACISMILQYWSQKDPRFRREVPTVDSIQRTLYAPEAHGIFARDMKQYLERQGLRAFTFPGDWDALKQQLSKGRPLIVCLREGSLESKLHYVVVAGLDSAQNLVFINDPADKKMAASHRADFEKSWKAARYWTLLAVPPS